MTSTAGLRLDITRTDAGLLITCDQLGPAFPPRCVRGMDQVGRVLDQAWQALDQQTTARHTAKTTAHGTARFTDDPQCHHPACRYAEGQDRHNPADWRRLHAGEALTWHPTTKKPVPCREGSWMSPAGHVYTPDSRRVPAAARRLADAGEFPPLTRAVG